MDDTADLIDQNIYTPKFKNWESKAYRRIVKIYGVDSAEYRALNEIKFHRIPGYELYDEVPIDVENAHFNSCLDQASLLFEALLEELEILPERQVEVEAISNISKIFISHASIDKKLVSEIVHLLTLIGVQDESIFCTSLDGYGIPLGENWLQTLKSEVSGEVIVLFVISENYYKSTVSLCEMGAAWALSKKHIPILIPPLDYDDMEGVIPLTQGFKITDKHKWTQLKSQLEPLLGISPKAPEIWESRRDEILERVENLSKND